MHSIAIGLGTFKFFPTRFSSLRPFYACRDMVGHPYVRQHWKTYLRINDQGIVKSVTRPFLRGGAKWVGCGSPSEAKQTRRGLQGGRAPCIRTFFEFALKIVVFDSKIFPILSKWIEFLHFLRNKLNYLVFDLHFINNNLQITFFFPIWFTFH